MDLAAAGLLEQPFRTHGGALTIVPYAGYNDALAMLFKTCNSPTGLSLLQGPSLSGKSTVVDEFVSSAPKECSIARFDGTALGTGSMLQKMLQEFGYTVDFNSTGEMLAMTRVFALQQASSHEPPIVIIENAHALNPSALRALSELAELRVQQTYALKMVLVSDRPLRDLIESPVMEAMSKRLTVDFKMQPMSKRETANFVHTKLRAAGSDVPEFVFPLSVCDELWAASGGWPGILDRIALLALADAETLPVSAASIEKPQLPDPMWNAQAIEEAHDAAGEPPAPPVLYVTQHGKPTRKIEFASSRLLIGRSEHNDIPIDSRFISRHHMLLVRNGSSTFLMDLNSTNGTFVNSRRVSNHVLIDDDIISVGHHRIKFCDPFARHRGTLDSAEFADTAIMKSLDDLRSLLSRENTEMLPAAPSENVPTLGGRSA